MEFRDSFSRLKKRVKHRLGESKPKPNETVADVAGERVDSTGSRPGSGPRVIAGGSRDQKGEELNADGGQVLSMIRLPQPDEPGPVLTRRSANNQEWREAEQADSHLHSVDIEVTEGSGPVERKDINQEKVEQVYPSPSTTSIPHDRKPDSA